MTTPDTTCFQVLWLSQKFIKKAVMNILILTDFNFIREPRKTLMILLVTNCRDVTTDFVVAELQRRSIPFYRLNTEMLPQASCVMNGFPKTAWSISLEGNTVCGEEIRAAYFRRPGTPEFITTPENLGEKAYMEAEWASFLKSLYMRMNDVWLNSPTAIFLAEDKPYQLTLASQIGFNVPFAQVTNNVDAVRRVTAAGPAVGKPLRQALLAGDRERVIFTTRLDCILEEDRQAISMAPFIVQTEILKKYDIRVTVVGKRVFATAIWSQEHQETEVDWRQGSRTDLKHERIKLPFLIERQCFELLQALGLRYGAIDLICDREDKLWFLEINPNGQWAWIENLTGFPISSAIADELESITRAENVA